MDRVNGEFDPTLSDEGRSSNRVTGLLLLLLLSFVCSFAMTVRAYEITFRDFVLKHCEREGTICHPGHIPAFRRSLAMVEVEDVIRIGFLTV